MKLQNIREMNDRELYTFINNISNKSVDLWSITRRGSSCKTGPKIFTASYNCMIQNYEFNGKRYVTYDDVINEARKL